MSQRVPDWRMCSGPPAMDCPCAMCRMVLAMVWEEYPLTMRALADGLADDDYGSLSPAYWRHTAIRRG